jgi:hypothetical protein
MELLSYNGGYIGYNADLSDTSIQTTGQTVDEYTGNIHIVGEGYGVGSSGSDTVVNLIVSSTGSTQIKKGDVIVSMAYADNYGATQNYLPKIINAGITSTFTTLSSRLNSADTNSVLSYTVCTADSPTVFIPTTNVPTVGFVLVAIRGLTMGENSSTLAALPIISGVATGTTGLPGDNSTSVGITYTGTAETWIVIQGYAIDDDIGVNGWQGVNNYEYHAGTVIGTSGSGGTYGIAAAVYKGPGGSFSSGAVSVLTSTTARATDGWSVHLVAFKAGLETKRTKTLKNTGVWNIKSYVEEKPTSEKIYVDGFPATSSYGGFNTPYFSQNFCRSAYCLSNSGSNSFPANINSSVNNISRLGYGSLYTGTYYTKVAQLNNTANGATAVVNTRGFTRVWVAEPCIIRFIMTTYGRSNDSSSYSVWQDSYQYGTQLASSNTIFNNGSLGVNSGYSSYYTITSPCYLVIFMQATLGGAGGTINNHWLDVYAEYIRVY